MKRNSVLGSIIKLQIYRIKRSGIYEKQYSFRKHNKVTNL